MKPRLAESKPSCMPLLADALVELNSRLAAMVAAMKDQTGREPGVDPFRGLYISESDVVRYLGDPGRTAPEFDRVAFLGNQFGLPPFELNVLLVALAPEIDPHYEAVFGYLQDDVTRRRPSVDLMLNLLHDGQDGLSKRALFAASAPLIRNRLIRLSGDEWTPLARREIFVDTRIAAFLFGDNSFGARLARFAELIRSARNAKQIDPGLAGLAGGMRGVSPAVLYFEGADRDSRRNAAIALSGEMNRPLLAADTDRALRYWPYPSAEFEEWLCDLEREAVLQDAVVYQEGFDSLEEPAREMVLRALPARGMTILSGQREWRPAAARINGVVSIRFEKPGWHERRQLWQSALREEGLYPDGPALDRLAECFRFNESQVEDAALTAARIASCQRQPLSVGHVFGAARSRSSGALGSLARKVVASHVWRDIVLPPEAIEQLYEICRRVTLRHRVLGEWGFASKLSGGKGVNALFHGHSGTGKTLAAEVIANELGLDLYKIELAGVVSKYIGETEKNLDRIFAAAEDANVILLFDEADALFGKRSEVRDSHDRYANLEVSYLLQKMEQYEGIAILATNLRQNLDNAFLRRLAFTVVFPFPDESDRRRIWEGIWPKQIPLAPDVDASWLAARYLLSGGNIRNVAVAAAFRAAAGPGMVTLEHVIEAVRGEFLKMGKVLTPAELAPPLSAVSGEAA
jgi:hypothetical protein